MRGAHLPALLLCCLLTGTAGAHEGHDHGVVAVIDTLPAAAGLHVQTASTLGAQIVLENAGKLPLTVLGDDGRGFLRIGPAGVEADVHHPDWLASYLPGGLPGRRAGGAPRWQQVRKSPSWGWFDSRLAEGEAGDSWEIPVLIGQQRGTLRGHFEKAVQRGYWRAAWRTPPELPPGVELMLVPGQPYGLMLGNGGTQPVSVLDVTGQPFLRIGVDGVALRPPGSHEWMPVSRGRRHVWVDARTQPLMANPSAGATRDWQIILTQGGRRWPLPGRSTWVMPPR